MADSLEPSTARRWCNKYGLSGSVNPKYREAAIRVLIDRLPEGEDRVLTADRLRGVASVPESFLDRTALPISDAPNIIMPQHAGVLLGSAVRSFDAYFDNAPDTEERRRADEELNMFRQLFGKSIPAKDFAELVAERFYTCDIPDFRMKLLGYALSHLQVRDDLERSLLTGKSWGGRHASSARNLYRTAWIAGSLRSGTDDDLEFALSLKDELVRQIKAQRASAIPAALALSALMNAYNDYPGEFIKDEELSGLLLEYMRRHRHDILMLRYVILMFSKLIPIFFDFLSTNNTFRAWALTVDNPEISSVNITGKAWVIQSDTNVSLGERIAALHAQYNTWIVRYPLLQLAQRRHVRVEALIPTAEEILRNQRASPGIQADALCYLARLQCPAAKQVLFVQIERRSEHARRAMVALMMMGEPGDLLRLVQLQTNDTSFEKQTVLRVLAKKLVVSGMSWRFAMQAWRLSLRDCAALIHQIRHERQAQNVPLALSAD